MTRYDTLMARIDGGERILIDGAVGTEVERRGVPQLDDAWTGGAALTHPEVLEAIHRDYLAAGAQILIANTFATHRQALVDAGVAGDFDALNRRGVELAVAARGDSAALVAGGISYFRWAPGWPPLSAQRDAAAEQAQIMAEAGADLIMLEMMLHIDYMEATLEGAARAGLPVWPGLSCRPRPDGVMALFRGDSLTEALTALRGRAPVITIMHTEVEHIDACLDITDAHWDGPVGVYAHSSRSVNNRWLTEDAITPADYAARASGWMERGVALIGGCCGTRVAHIEALAPMIPAPKKA